MKKNDLNSETEEAKLNVHAESEHTSYQEDCFMT